ncbi:succinate receptor 1-like [Saccostrea echinata]|uniref:succinate receptor 1-like n=1 Tax=Saccostrea echinata TaxID=191078 RepID=UPI002A81CD73|nr:succinate receptor 1-like [Saccostrea echinata]
MDNDTYISEKLERWNRELVESLILNNVILSLYIIAGLLGNSTVIIIYSFMMKSNKEERYFIPFLAIVDLCACLVSSSSGIALNMMQATFYNNLACKTLQFLVPFFTLSSVLFLLIIAVNRYLKVCRPFGKQMTLKWKQFAMCLSLITALMFSLPMIYFFGIVPFPNIEEGIIGWRCSRSKSADKTLSLTFGGFLLIAIITIIFSLVILYSKIGYTIFRHFNKTETERQKAENPINKEQFRKRMSSHDGSLNEEENKKCSLKTDSTKLSSNYSIKTDNMESSSAYPQASTKTTKKDANSRISPFNGTTDGVTVDKGCFLLHGTQSHP